MTKKNLVFLPGWSGTEKAWQFQQQALNDIVDSYVIVLTEEDSIDKMVQTVLKQAPEKFILVGHSIGGWVAQVLASTAKNRVESLILLSTWTGDTSQFTRDYFQNLYPHIKNNTLAPIMAELRAWNISPHLPKNHPAFAIFKDMQDNFSQEGYFNQTKALLDSPSCTFLLKEIQCPTLIVEGQDDPCFTIEQQMVMVKNIKNSKFTLIPHCGHMLTIEQPEAVTALVRLWINSTLE